MTHLLVALSLLLALPPRPVAPRVGCYYFPGWYCADRWAPIVEYGDRDPVIGYYRDADPRTQDWHIRQATQHGISFWVFDWYYDSSTGTVLAHNAALDKGFLSASLNRKMDFALMWCNEESGEPDYTEATMMRLVSTIGARYLGRPNYLRAPDRRNILVISRPDRLIKRFGLEGTRAMLHKMSNAARQWGGLYPVAIQNPTPGILRQMRDAGFEACTLYCYSTHGMKGWQAQSPYDTILPAVEPLWRTGSACRELPVIPCVSPGWDSAVWYGDRGLTRTGSTPAKFGALCRALKPYVDPRLGMVMAGTWNEFGEGTYLEPTRQRGCGFLDAMQRAFQPGVGPHRLLDPTEAERSAISFSDIPTHLEERMARNSGNLLANPGFEGDWGWDCFDAAPARFSTTVVHGGKRALALAKVQGGVKSHPLEPGVAWPFRADNTVKLDQGRTFKVRAWVHGKAELIAALFSADRRWLGRYQPIAEGGAPGEWRLLEAAVTVRDSEAASIDLEVVPKDPLVYVDDVGVWRQ